MIPRVLEPEAMETADEAADYDAMDHTAVNERFVADFLRVLDGGANVSVELTDPQSACVCRTDDGYGYVIMPLAAD